MKQALYEKYAETAAIGYYAMGIFGGLEILDIIHGIDNYAVACFNFGTGRQKIRRHKVYSTPAGRNYIRKEGDRYYLDEMMRAW